MSHIYVNLINDDSDEDCSASEGEGEYRSDVSDGQGHASNVAPFIPPPIVVAPIAIPKKRGRPLKAVTEARLSALYHGASTIENKAHNGAPFDGAQTTPVLTPKKRGRKPKSESEKQNSRPKSLLRINIGPKAKTRKIEASSPDESPFPLVQHAVKTDSAKKSRGRPRIHPPKDPSAKRPRGRPRLNPLQGEQSYKTEYLKMKRECEKKDALIDRLTQYLAEIGHSIEDVLQMNDHNSQSNDDAEEKSKPNEESAEEVIETIEANNIEHSNQKYIGMFVEDNDDKEKDEDSD